jgi:electron transfer flavoprotein alpha subunit
MAKVLVYVEVKEGKVKKSSLEILTSVAQKHTVFAALIGDGVSSLAKELNAQGAKTVFVVEDKALSGFSNKRFADALISVIKAVSPDYVFASHTPSGRDFMPLVAAGLEVGLASDCTGVQFVGDAIELKRPLYAGKALVKIEFLPTSVKLATLRSNALSVVKADAQPESVQTLAFAAGAYRSELMELVKGSSARPDVAEAAIVISGGRSLKAAENFKILEDFADLAQAGVGASRAAVDAGLRPHRDQVGQTGKVVSPLLYIACGISGAIQHLAGMRTSKIIVAINTDPEAPIFQVADYGVVGDLFAFVPLLTQELKKLKE